MNEQAIKDAFIQKMNDVGIPFSGNIIADGKIHQFHIEGQKKGSKNGRYILHLDGKKPSGYFQDWSVPDSKQNWSYNGKVDYIQPSEAVCKPTSHKFTAC